jgi:hypothetical protein
MEELISLAAIIPILGGVVACVSALSVVVKRTRAERKFVHELSDEIGKIVNVKLSVDPEQLRQVEVDQCRRLYISAVRNRAKNEALPKYLSDALSDLSKQEKAVIISALKQPSSAGRKKYIDKVFRQALEITRHLV